MSVEYFYTRKRESGKKGDLTRFTINTNINLVDLVLSKAIIFSHSFLK